MLRVENIYKSFHNKPALKDVSIDIPENTIFGLLGPNGAGKTTLIRIITQILQADKGNIYFKDALLEPKHIYDMGYLPEERGLYKKMKVGEQCLYLAQLKGMSKKEAKSKLKDWFEKFEIGDWWNKKVEELSKGMAQKIQFITTVLHEPDLLIMDEPFSGFDPVNASLIKNEIIELKKKCTIILSTHNMNSVEQICDDIALINDSKVILKGALKDVKSSYSENRWKITFKGHIVSFTNSLWTAGELIDKKDLTNYHWEVILKLGENQSINSALQAVLPEVEILKVERDIPHMDDIFIKAVQKEEVL